MRNLKEITVALLFTGLLGSAGEAQAAEHTKNIDELMRRYHDLGQFNGSALVALSGKVTLNRGYGLANKEWDIPNDGKTRHRVGSITKSFTAALVVQLAAEQSLALDKTIRDYLPDYAQHAGGSITLRQLLTHTGGIPNYTRSNEFWQSGAATIPHTAREFVRRYCSAPPEFQPGERYQYGNSGYSILGAIIEAVTGKSYAEMLRERILEPAGMKDSGVDSALTIMPRRANGYERETHLAAMAENIVRVLYGLPYAEPEPRIVDLLFEKLEAGSVAEAVAFYRAKRESDPDDYLFFPWPLRILGQQMLREGKFGLAADLLALNAETHPSDARTQELLAEALRRRPTASE